MTTEAATFLQRVSLAIAGAEDLPSPVDVPEIQGDDERTAFDALAHKIYDGLVGPPDKRAGSPEGKLASMLWQRVAEWDERAGPDATE